VYEGEYNACDHDSGLNGATGTQPGSSDANQTELDFSICTNCGRGHIICDQSASANFGMKTSEHVGIAAGKIWTNHLYLKSESR